MATPQVFIDVGDAQAVDPLPTGAWDTARWDGADARWSGTMPNWREISCRVRHVRIDGGRAGALDVFTPRSALVEVANPDGWATWSPQAPGPITDGAWLRVRIDAQPIFTGTVRTITDNYSPGARPGAAIVATDALARLGDVDVEDLPDARGGGETAAERIGWLLDYAAWPPQARSLDAGGPELAPFRSGGNLVDLAQRAAVTAGGCLFANREGIICYRGADWLRTDPRATAPVARVTNTPTAPPAPTPTNRVSLPGADIEDPTLHYGAESGALVSRSSAWAAHGTYSLRTARPATAGNIVATMLAAGRAAVTPGETITAAATLYSAAARQVTLQVRFYDAAGVQVPGTEATTAYRRAVNLAAGAAQDAAYQMTVPAGAARAGLRVFALSVPANDGLHFDQVMTAGGTWPAGSWVAPGYVPPVPVPQLCAVAMAPSGRDTEWVYNVATVAGADESTDPETTAEVRRVDQDSWFRYGPAVWPISGLYSVDVDQLGVIASRAIGLRSRPRPRIDSLDLSPVADPAVGPFLAQLRYGDRIHTDYVDRLGWGWAVRSHVHGIAHDIAPSGVENRAAVWTCALTLDDADYWQPGPAWDYGTWGTARWGSAPAATSTEGVPQWA